MTRRKRWLPEPPPPEPCETCQRPMVFRWERDPDVPEDNLFGYDGGFSCQHGCYTCVHCLRRFKAPDMPGPKTLPCDACQAARKRRNGPRYCECGAPMVPHGLPAVFVCLRGCATCDTCGDLVSLGASCSTCNDDMDQDIPF